MHSEPRIDRPRELAELFGACLLAKLLEGLDPQSPRPSPRFAAAFRAGLDGLADGHRLPPMVPLGGRHQDHRAILVDVSIVRKANGQFGELFACGNEVTRRLQQPGVGDGQVTGNCRGSGLADKSRTCPKQHGQDFVSEGRGIGSDPLRGAADHGVGDKVRQSGQRGELCGCFGRIAPGHREVEEQAAGTFRVGRFAVVCYFANL